MTRRATLTQAEMARAIKAAAVCGKVAVLTSQGIAFVDADKVPLDTPPPPPQAGDSCDGKFGRQR